MEATDKIYLGTMVHRQSPLFSEKLGAIHGHSTRSGSAKEGKQQGRWKTRSFNNEIKWTKTGDWQTLERGRDSKQSEDGFADPALSPIRFSVTGRPGK